MCLLARADAPLACMVGISRNFYRKLGSACEETVSGNLPMRQGKLGESLSEAGRARTQHTTSDHHPGTAVTTQWPQRAQPTRGNATAGRFTHSRAAPARAEPRRRLRVRRGCTRSGRRQTRHSCTARTAARHAPSARSSRPGSRGTRYGAREPATVLYSGRVDKQAPRCWRPCVSETHIVQL